MMIDEVSLVLGIIIGGFLTSVVFVAIHAPRNHTVDKPEKQLHPRRRRKVHKEKESPKIRHPLPFDKYRASPKYSKPFPTYPPVKPKKKNP